MTVSGCACQEASKILYLKSVFSVDTCSATPHCPHCRSPPSRNKPNRGTYKVVMLTKLYLFSDCSARKFSEHKQRKLPCLPTIPLGGAGRARSRVCASVLVRVFVGHIVETFGKLNTTSQKNVLCI